MPKRRSRPAPTRLGVNPDFTRSDRLRIAALELAIKAAPLTLGRQPTIKGAELLEQAEHIAAWLKKDQGA